jgi:LAGLIDADG-like domain
MLGLDVPVATPTGWTKVGDLRIGDEVFDRNGQPCAVVEVSQPFGGRDCFAIETNDGERVVTSGAQQWIVTVAPRRPERPRPSAEMGRVRTLRRRISAGAILDLPHAALPMDPYVLGAWLANGESKVGIFTHRDERLAANIRDRGYECRPGYTAGIWYLTDADGGRGRPGRFLNEMRAADVWGNKHVPAPYLRASRAQRLALLQGIVDTEGVVSSRRGEVALRSTNERLIDGLRELVYTLGAKATKTSPPSLAARPRQRQLWMVRFLLADAATLPEKTALCRDSPQSRTRYAEAQDVASVPVRAVTVDSPDGTLLVGRTLLPTYGGVESARALRIPAQRSSDLVGGLR